MSRRTLLVWFGAAWLVVGGSVSAQTVEVGPPPTVDVQALQQQYERERGRAANFVAVESDRPGFIAGLATRWAATARERGFGGDWADELQSLAMRAPTERLAAAGQAATYEGVIDALVGSGGQPRVLGDDASDLVFFPVTPCRLLDTRLAGGLLAGGTGRTFGVNGTPGNPGNLSGQGGAATDCGIPVDPAAVVVTLTIDQPQGLGNLRAFQALLATPPLASVLNYGVTAQALANTTVIPVCQGCGTGIDIVIQADVSGTHVIADVVGYFWSPFATALDTVLVSGTAPVAAFGNVALLSPVCPAGRTVTGGGQTSTNFLVYAVSSFASGNRWQCAARNTAATAETFTCAASCARVPGR